MTRIRAKLPPDTGLYYEDDGSIMTTNLLPREKSLAIAAPFSIANAMLRLGSATISGGYIHVSYSVPCEEITDGT